jgi:vacuolar-type H+-ATPase subunit C/Vma6
LTDPSQYAPALAKIGALRSTLLSEVKIKGFSEAESLEQIAAQLRDSTYQEQIAKIVPPLIGRKMERAFNENFIESLLKIIENSPKQAAEFLELHLLHYEVEHVKFLLKAINTKNTVEQMLGKIYFSVEDYFKKHALLEEVARASTINHVVYVFKSTEYFVPLNIALKNYKETGSTATFDIYLDRYYFEKLYERFQNLSSKDKEYAEFYARMENDAFTILTLLRGKLLNLDPNRLRIIIPQKYFELSKAEVESLVTAIDFEATLKLVLESSYGKYFVMAPDPHDTIANAEKTFTKALLEHAKASRVIDTFNIGLPLGFLTIKKAEVHNLVAASLGIESGMNPEAIRNLLII